ncbi:endonuclease domain-containing protein [Streptomyces sp. Ju416(a)]|uniref:endonuclease domain-containing protein n=1 Tax=Streptomyces sp. Ju416(a) TaxID=3446591 RepID=UPI00403DE925
MTTSRGADTEPSELTRTCNKCAQAKPLEQFPKRDKQTRKYTCKPCYNEIRRTRGDYLRCNRTRKPEAPGAGRWRGLKERYGLTREQYVALAAAQSGVCAMCQQPPKSVRPLVVDHCHNTGVIRGLLCVYCNVAVGIHENHRHAAAAYLAAYGSGNPLLNQIGGTS